MTQVAVLGGGVGGLSAAHELAERGVDVSLFEARARFGGKARSMPIDGEGTLHGEHGFRFFPAFYRHVVDTMARIPDGNGTVADNLVPTSETLIAGISRPDRLGETGTPTTVREWFQRLQPAFADDLPRRDVRFLLERLCYLLTACRKRRETELEAMSWWEFVDAEHRSPEFRDRLAYATQSLVALRPQVGSARTIGTIYLQLLFGQLDPTRPAERVLNGPTNDVWIDPWIDRLTELGVDLHAATPVADLTLDGDRVSTAVLEDGRTVAADEFVLAVPVHVAPEFVTPSLARAAPALAGIDRLDTAWMNGIQFYLDDDVELTRGHQVYTESPWALTSISQRQFWDVAAIDRRAPDQVEGVLSVIASEWDTPGVVYEKSARNCTREEIAEEIWTQVQSHLNTNGTRLPEDALVEWFLDPALVETESGVENRSPLLINTAGSLRHRPPADTAVENLSIAGDYVRTNTDLASMESAAEAGRRAANAILERHGYDDPARIWELQEPAVFEPFKRQDRLRYRLGLPHPAKVTHSLRSLPRAVRRSV
ncbi:FAD-binding protein [Salinadaptatus halalkaliphilus]|uniref:FAD-binding protein n=1 Tax=Salinadaptatus halalkaliphilus TaxID=2419781 RepID=A0A4S3THK5_9EURY|nr:FAD-dependent oxidoreductase [Salinadaptatus halalkaliphilus]THE62970.1 FAD-binding protein [Salinadaptatus halalkaliphilus]